jgi:VWFA-related protein
MISLLSSGARRWSATAFSVAGLSSCLALCVTVRGAQKAEPARPSQLTFPVDTRQVQVSVVVHDKSGAPVRGLTAADFEVFEKGKLQLIESFSVESDIAPLPPASPSDPPRTSFDNVQGRIGGVTIILLDRLNTAWEDQAYAKKQIVKFLGQIQPDDRVGLYVLESNTVRVLHDVTTDASSLLRSLSRYRESGSAELEASQTRAEQTGETDTDFDVFLRESARIISAAFTRQRAETTAEAFVALANYLAGVHGRKNLVWVSSSFPLMFDDPTGLGSPQELNRGNVSQDVQRASRSMSEAGVVIYPVHAHGMVSAFAVDPATVQATPGARGRPMATAFTTLEGATAPFDSGKTLAENTGGRAFSHSNDIAGAIRRAVDDARVTYLLGYSPTHGKWDGRFHEIQVKVKRPGLEVRHRKGYVAFPLEERGKVDTTHVLARTLRSPLEATAIPIGVNLERVEATDGSDMNVAIRVDPRPFTLEEKGGKWHGEVALVIAQTNAEGRTFRDYDKNILLHLTAAEREQLLTQGIVLNKRIKLRDDLLRLSVVVSDAPSGAVGSVTIPAEKVKAAIRR